MTQNNVARHLMLVHLLLLVSLLFSASSYAQTGPVGYWKFDEAAGTAPQDSSGNANHCTASPAPAWTTGRINGALSFDGVDDTLTCGSGSTLGTLTQMTVSAWVNLTSLGEGSLGRLLQKGTGGNPTAGWRLVTQGTNQLEFAVDFATADLDRISAINVIPVNTNTWAHVLVTWDGTTLGTGIKIYVNGAEVGYASTDNASGARNSDTAAVLRIGNIDTGTRTTNGKIDDVRVYNRVLSLTEIQALADSQVPGAPVAPSATAVGTNQINVAWTVPTDNVGVTGYLVERCQGVDCVLFSQIATPTANSFSDTGLAASSSYSYQIRAMDANTNKSLYSAVVSATTGAAAIVPGAATYGYDNAGRLVTASYSDGTVLTHTLDAAGNRVTAAIGDNVAPSVPTGVTAISISATRVDLSWTASTDTGVVGLAGYNIFRDGAQIGTASGTTYSDLTVVAGISYQYSLSAYDSGGNTSAQSAPISVDRTPPTAPTMLVAGAPSSTLVNLDWVASTDPGGSGVAGYQIVR
ncbi:MAG: LamG-like jellyroll fold domain-containing protein, partial [Gammaproteobacteria bacterium]